MNIYVKFLMGSLIGAATAFLLSCGGSPDSTKEQQEDGNDDNTEKEITGYTITALSGWDVYTAGTYRYGPSIIINEDGSIDAWFAATGGSFAEDAGERFFTGDWSSAFAISGSTTAAQAFTTSEDFFSLAVCCPTWSSSGTEDLSISLFAWEGSYITSVEGDPVCSKRFVQMKDNGWNEVKKDDGSKFPAGSYVLLLHDGSNNTQQPGVWFRRKASIPGRNLQAYKNGSPVDDVLQIILNYEDAGGIDGSYWDQASYQRSTNKGKTWSDEIMALKPTKGSRDELSCCDPGVIKLGEYYYIGYTSTENQGGVDNHLYMARGKSQTGPWEKWNGEGWGGNNVQPVVEYTGNHSSWGVGEPSMVAVDGTLYLYYSWNDGGTTTRVSTAPADDPLWPAHLTYKGVAIDKSSMSAADHSDVKYIDSIKRFIAVNTASRMTKDAFIQIWESEDGISFKKTQTLTGPLGAGLHNCGISGDPQGHIDVNVQQFIGYAYGLDSEGHSSWGRWNTKINPLKFSPKY